MHIKLLISAAAIALAAGLGTASAAEQMETLGVEVDAVQLDQHEMETIRGGVGTLITPGTIVNNDGTIGRIGGTIGIAECAHMACTMGPLTILPANN